jgi:glycosyltransferase involved in cell wall biosynthesis
MNMSQSGNGIEKRPTICLIPQLSGIGGMVSFQAKLAVGLSRRGINVCYQLDDTNPVSILVIGGTRNLHHLWQAKRRGTRIVQRLDGMNWIHRVMNTGVNHWIRAEYGNVILRVIRSYLADKIAYQSNFSKEWWERERGKTVCHNIVIHNGVDLSKFKPPGNDGIQKDDIHLLLVEGSLLGGYEFGLENAILFANELTRLIHGSRRVELAVVGKVSQTLKEYWINWVNENATPGALEIKWLGVIDHVRIPEVYKEADLLFSADINAACPNSVIESLASGTPVIAFDTGALPELLADKGGIVVPYGGNPWNIDQPYITSLAENARVLLDNLNGYRKSARRHAESAFDLEFMVDQYVELLLG